MPNPRHVIIGTDTFRIDEDADVPFRRISNSVMVPRQDISGVPGAINLQRDVWLWSLSDFVGGEGRLVFDSADPVGPPTFQKSDGGIDVRTKGEFSLHPDEKLVANTTGGGSAATVNTWEATGAAGAVYSTVAGTPTYQTGPASNHIRLGRNDEVKVKDNRNHSTGEVVVVTARLVNIKTTKANKRCDVKLVVYNVTNSVNVVTKTKSSLKENEPATLSVSFTATTGKDYSYRVSNVDAATGASADLKYVEEAVYTTAPAASQDIRDVKVGVLDNVWATAYDGTKLDVLEWNFGTGTWDQAAGDVTTGEPRAMTGSDQFQYILTDDGAVWQVASDGTATQYVTDPTTAGFAGNHGEPLGIAVANNKLYTLYSQGLFEITLDASSGIPFSIGADYTRVAAPGEFYKEKSPDTTLRQHISALSNGVRFFTNVRGEQTTIWEYSDGTLQAPHFLPSGYVVTAIKHYANITFIAASFTNEAASPAESRAGIFYISSDDLLRFLGYLRFNDTNSQPVSYITAYGHDMYFLQGQRVWRYNLGSGGLTLENVTSCYDETKARALARMDKKFWAAYEGEGTYVTDDSYPTTTMWLYSPLWDYDVPDLDKVLLSVDLDTRPLPANTKVEVEYALDDGDWVAAGSMSTTGDTFEKLTISTSSSTVKFKNIQWRCGLTSIDGTDTPRVLAVTIRAYVLEYEDSFDLTILLDDEDPENRLVSSQLSGRAKAKKLWTYKNNKTLVAFNDYYSSKIPGDPDTYTVVVEDPFQEITEQGQSSMRIKLKVVS